MRGCAAQLPLSPAQCREAPPQWLPAPAMRTGRYTLGRPDETWGLPGCVAGDRNY